MLEGRLNEFRLPDVFRLLALTGKTGVLRVAVSHGEGQVHFDEGAVCFAVSDVGRLQLGARLLDRGVINPAGLDRVLAAQRSGDLASLAGELTGDRAGAEETLREVVREQIADAVFTLMRVEDGGFAFDSAPATAPGLVTVVVDELIAESTRRLDEWERIARLLPPPGSVVALTTDLRAGTVALDAAQWRLVAMVEGGRSAADLAELTGQGEFRTAQIVAGLVDAGLLTVRSGTESWSPARARHEALRRLDEGEARTPTPEPSGIVHPSPADVGAAEPAAMPAERLIEPVGLLDDEATRLPVPVPVELATRDPVGPPDRHEAPDPDPLAFFMAQDPTEEPLSPAEPVGLPGEETLEPVPSPADEATPEGFTGEPPTGPAAGEEPAGAVGGPAGPAAPFPGDDPARERLTTLRQRLQHAGFAAEPPVVTAASAAQRSEAAPVAVPEPRPLAAARDVDRASMARELAALGLDDPVEAPPAPRAPDGAAAARRLTRDQDVSKGLLLRLIDGVKGV